MFAKGLSSESSQGLMYGSSNELDGMVHNAGCSCCVHMDISLGMKHFVALRFWLSSSEFKFEKYASS